MGPLSSQTKCNTFLGGCCDGTQVRTAVIGRAMRDCQTSSRRVLPRFAGASTRQLSLDERCEIARLQADGCSHRQIAAALDRSPSSISREVRRNSGRAIGYRPTYAQEQTQARRWSGSRLDHDPDLRRAVFERLAKGWSPEQV